MRCIIRISVLVLLLSLFQCKNSHHKDLNYSTLIESSVYYYNEGDLDSALYFAKLSSEKIAFPVSSQMRYFLMLAKEKEDKEWLYFLSEKLIRGGAPLSYVKRHLDDNAFTELQVISEELVKEFNSRFNSNYRNRLKDIFKFDTEFNQKYHKWRRGEIELSKEEMINGAEQVYSKFMILNEEIGFPSESTLGYFIEDNKMISYHTTLLFHIYQSGELVFHDELDSLYRIGLIDASLVQNLKMNRGFGDSSGIRNEMSLRYDRFSKK